MIKSAEGSAGLLRKITKLTTWRGGAQILKKEKTMPGSGTAVKQRGNNRQSAGNVTKVCRTCRTGRGKIGFETVGGGLVKAKRA